MRSLKVILLISASLLAVVSSVRGQAFGPPDRGRPGDEMIQQYLANETTKTHATFMDRAGSSEDWNRLRKRYEREYFYMLGLWPKPERTPLEATVTGSLEGDGYVVDMLHYQSRPHLYVTGNLYRPAEVQPGRKLPAVLYVCGHSLRGRNGNKTAYQSHGIWFARHGYICLVVDTLQLGEIAAIHHGTYRENRWWWHSRGYTSAGVECWNGIRGIDYLIGRPDVDPERIAVTGISGGAAATFWIAAADRRVHVAVPVSGMADLPSYVSNRVINGHCDCMFLYNTFRWPWTRIAAMIAPRPLLFVNSDADRIFPMDANERIINRLERLYSLFGAGDRVDSLVSIGGHAYRQDIRQGAFRFINSHLKNDPRFVTDSEVDLVTGSRNNNVHPIEPEKLRAFRTDGDIPDDELNTTIDQHFVPVAKVDIPSAADFKAWKQSLVQELGRVSFGYFPKRIPAAKPLNQTDPRDLQTEEPIRVRTRVVRSPSGKPNRLLLAVTNPSQGVQTVAWLGEVIQPDDRVIVCDPRGVGKSEWTRKNPPNYVRRSHALLGRTVDTGRVWDAIAVARRYAADTDVPVHVCGRGAAGIIAAYAALLEPDIAGAIVVDPPATHMSPDSPQFLNVLRVCDVPDALGMIAPRPLQIVGGDKHVVEKTVKIYASAGAADIVVTQKHTE